MKTFSSDWLLSSREVVLKNLIVEHSDEIKPGYKHAIKLSNKKENWKIWISSTNNPEVREQTLKNVLRNNKKWHGPWLDNFGDLEENKILDDIKFEHFPLSSLSYQDLINNSFDKSFISEDFENELKKLLREFATENNINKKLNLDFAKEIENSIAECKKNNSLIIKNLIEKIDEIIFKYISN